MSSGCAILIRLVPHAVAAANMFMTVLARRMILMDIKSGKTYPSCALSNFAPHPFVFEGVQCNSMEGFLQGLKFKNAEMQRHICTLVGFKAKKSGANKNWQRDQTLYWLGLPYKRDSDGYQTLLDEAYWALFSQNEKARNALLATQGANLTHSIGRNKKNETVLTKQEFCSRLMNIRKMLNAADSLKF